MDKSVFSNKLSYIFIVTLMTFVNSENCNKDLIKCVSDNVNKELSDNPVKNITDVEQLKINEDFLINLNETFQNITQFLAKELNKFVEITAESDIINNENVFVKIFNLDEKLKHQKQENVHKTSVNEVNLTKSDDKYLKKLEKIGEIDLKEFMTSLMPNITFDLTPNNVNHKKLQDMVTDATIAIKNKSLANKTTINTIKINTSHIKTKQANENKKPLQNKALSPKKQHNIIKMKSVVKPEFHHLSHETSTAGRHPPNTTAIATEPEFEEKNITENISEHKKEKTTSETTEDVTEKEQSFREEIKKALLAKQNAISGDYSEYYEDLYVNITDYFYPNIDYLELYEDTTNEYITEEYTTEGVVIEDYVSTTEDILNNENETFTTCHKNVTSDVKSAILPWVAAIFVKNDVTTRFDYVCDGVLLKMNVVLTSARCLHMNGTVINKNNILVILGKTSLQSSNPNEIVLKINDIIIHENFTENGNSVRNDVAQLLLEGDAKLGDKIQTACIKYNGTKTKTEGNGFTTGWNVNGEFTVIETESDAFPSSSQCSNPNGGIICALYKKDLSTCASQGGIFIEISSNNIISVIGIRFSNTISSNYCYGKNIMFTKLYNFYDWLEVN